MLQKTPCLTIIQKVDFIVKSKIQEYFFKDYIFMLIDINSTVYVIASLNRFKKKAVLGGTNLHPS